MVYVLPEFHSDISNGFAIYEYKHIHRTARSKVRIERPRHCLFVLLGKKRLETQDQEYSFIDQAHGTEQGEKLAAAPITSISTSQPKNSLKPPRARRRRRDFLSFQSRVRLSFPRSLALMAAASRVGDPAESTRLRIGDEIAWSEISGVYDRDDSLKENTNPKCLLKNHPGANNGASQRFSGNLKPTAAPIIGLSGKLGQGGGRGRHHPPRRPSSPRRPRRGRRARARAAVPGPLAQGVLHREGALRPRACAPRPPAEAARGDGGGCCGGLAFFMRRNRSRNSVECVDQSPPLPPVVETARRRETKEVEAASAAAPGLGGMRRFASGRRAAEWAAEMDGDGRVATSGPL
ncbi:unnamed protein product [Miscanthus lutarioriparius]|uniref:Uncharacterized protein n=1 Tax=Miscanthus lutarioriparius TaxID=422564 RepID=A0A811Q6L2_9POAL|nr:unnamed protein product [Miscanthus lutarioriparius]